MNLENDRYTYRMVWSEEDNEYVGTCLEFPSLSWLDTSPEAALSGIREVVASAVTDMVEAGETIPEPLSVRKYSGKFMVRIPQETHRRLAIEAAEAGISINRLASAKLGMALA